MNYRWNTGIVHSTKESWQTYDSFSEIIHSSKNIYSQLYSLSTRYVRIIFNSKYDFIENKQIKLSLRKRET